MKMEQWTHRLGHRRLFLTIYVGDTKLPERTAYITRFIVEAMLVRIREPIFRPGFHDDNVTKALIFL